MFKEESVRKKLNDPSINGRSFCFEFSMKNSFLFYVSAIKENGWPLGEENQTLFFPICAEEDISFQSDLRKVWPRGMVTESLCS